MHCVTLLRASADMIMSREAKCIKESSSSEVGLSCLPLQIKCTALLEKIFYSNLALLDNKVYISTWQLQISIFLISVRNVDFITLLSDELIPVQGELVLPKEQDFES